MTDTRSGYEHLKDEAVEAFEYVLGLGEYNPYNHPQSRRRRANMPR